MTVPKVEIYWTEDGQMIVEVEGLGQTCVDGTAALEALLGMVGNDATKELKPEYHEGGDGDKRTQSLNRG
jgi:hypothetical protein